jgi:hypothetical protein
MERVQRCAHAAMDGLCEDASVGKYAVLLSRWSQLIT